MDNILNVLNQTTEFPQDLATADYPKSEFWKYVNFKAIKTAHFESLLFPIWKFEHQDRKLTLSISWTDSPQNVSQLFDDEEVSMAFASDDHWMRPMLEQKTDYTENPFYKSQILVDRKPLTVCFKGKTTKPYELHVKFEYPKTEMTYLVMPRLNLIWEPQSEGVVYLETSSIASQSFASLLIQSHIKKAATAKIYYRQNASYELNHQHFYQAIVRVDQDAFFQHYDFCAPTAWCRHHIYVRLHEQGAQTHLKAAYFNADQFYSDHHTLVQHGQPHTQSVQDYRGLLTDQSKSVFNGLIQVAPKAEQSNSQLLNKNLMLSKQAEINTKPELKIDNDNVKASHGATVGQLDNEQLFYLLSRGISKTIADQLLARAFISDIIEDQSDSVKGFYEPVIQIFLNSKGRSHEI